MPVSLVGMIIINGNLVCPSGYLRRLGVDAEPLPAPPPAADVVEHTMAFNTWCLSIHD
jgi:hypothetical protein